ncbi:MAG: hypothetical protein AAGN35_05520 [Bacteroidota bacterium]
MKYLLKLGFFGLAVTLFAILLLPSCQNGSPAKKISNNLPAITQADGDATSDAHVIYARCQPKIRKALAIENGYRIPSDLCFVFSSNFDGGDLGIPINEVVDLIEFDLVVTSFVGMPDNPLPDFGYSDPALCGGEPFYVINHGTPAINIGDGTVTIPSSIEFAGIACPEATIRPTGGLIMVVGDAMPDEQISIAMQNIRAIKQGNTVTITDSAANFNCDW